MQNDPITISGRQVNPGERCVIKSSLPELYDGSPMYMPIHVFCGKLKGPTLIVLAALHGDEINGVEIIHRLMKRKMLTRIKGNLICIPIANMYGFIFKNRYLMDRRDLNRSFPGSAKGSIASRLAKFLLDEIMVHADMIIDLHTASLHRVNIPQIRATLDNQQIHEDAKSFAAPVILDSPVLPGSLREAVHKFNIPYLLYESGEALRFDELSIRMGVKGIFNVMRHLGMLKTTLRKVDVSSTVSYSSKWIRANGSGMMTAVKKLGARVSQDEVVAKIVDPMTLEETAIIAPLPGIIIGMTRLPLVHEGEALFHIASVKKPKETAEIIADLELIYDH